MDTTARTFLQMVDRVTMIEPQLRDTVSAARQTAGDAVGNCFLNLAWKVGSQQHDDADQCVWNDARRAYRTAEQQLTRVLKELTANAAAPQGPEAFRDLRDQLKAAVTQLDTAGAQLDQASLCAAKAVRRKLLSFRREDPRMKVIGASAVDTSKAVIALANRLAIVASHPPTMGDAQQH